MPNHRENVTLEKCLQLFVSHLASLTQHSGGFSSLRGTRLLGSHPLKELLMKHAVQSPASHAGKSSGEADKTQ